MPRLYAPPPPRVIAGGYHSGWQRLVPESAQNATSGAGAYGSYVQQTAGEARDLCITSIWPYCGNTTSTSSWMQWALGAGSSGNEIVIGEWNAGKISAGVTASPAGVLPLTFPIFIPAGTRLALKVASNSNAQGNCQIFMQTVPLDRVAATHVVAPVGKGASSIARPYSYYPIDSLVAAPSPTPGTWPTPGAWFNYANRVPVNSYLVGAALSGGSHTAAVGISEIGFGESGSERVVASWAGAGVSAPPIGGGAHEPVFIPQGARMVVRSMNATASTQSCLMPYLVPESALIPVEQLGVTPFLR